jgi:uncharacterized phage protein (TIGR02220 family)
MEIIQFINDLRNMGVQYYNIWIPIILRFDKEQNEVKIALNSPLDLPRSTYYRIINYGVSVFPKYLESYVLNKKHNSLILTKKEANFEECINQIEEPQKVVEIIQEQVVEIVEVVVEKPKQTRKKAQESSYPNEVYETIIDYLNQLTGKNYKNNSVINRKFITSRLNDGFTVDDFKRVIEVKSTNWLGGKMEQFLRPETLFSNKFEAYLNENINSNLPKSNLKNTYDQVSLATEYYNNQQ